MAHTTAFDALLTNLSIDDLEAWLTGELNTDRIPLSVATAYLARIPNASAVGTAFIVLIKNIKQIQTEHPGLLRSALDQVQAEATS